MTDPIRDARLRQQETRRARSHSTFVQALMAGKAPSATAFCAALDMGHDGDQALTAAYELDQAAAAFFTNPPTDTPPAAA